MASFFFSRANCFYCVTLLQVVGTEKELQFTVGTTLLYGYISVLYGYLCVVKAAEKSKFHIRHCF